MPALKGGGVTKRVTTAHSDTATKEEKSPKAEKKKKTPSHGNDIQHSRRRGGDQGTGLLPLTRPCLEGP